MLNLGFDRPFTDDLAEELERRALNARGTVLTATTLAASGHPGGSMSSMELYTVLYSCARVRPADPRWPDRDRIVVSHGHTSPGVYSALAEAGFFESREVAAHFRQTGMVFEGHVERSVPGVEWSTGNLGQGLAAGVGMALGARITGATYHTYVAMSDGEQHKGQVAEARQLAVRHGLVDLTVIVDLNGIQISGHTRDIMPVDVASGFAADGWGVLEVDGHDIRAVYEALATATRDDSSPVAIIAHTVIGKGVSFMEDEAEFHGRGLTNDEYVEAMRELDLDPGALEEARIRRSEPCEVCPIPHLTPAIAIHAGTPRVYAPDARTDNRSAWGGALLDLAEANGGTPLAVFDCDLATSVKTEEFAERYPASFIECGVGEHSAAIASGALSTCGVLTFWADFGVFGIDEVYNHQRLNDINGAGLKLVVTHCGLDVGEDGKTHQCLDYVGALREFPGWKVIVPADPNQTDGAVRAAAAMQGNVAVAMGRSKLAVIRDPAGDPLFAGREFRYGEIVWAREGEALSVLAMGTVAGAAVEAADAIGAHGGPRVAAGVVSCPLALEDSALERAASTGVIVTVEDHTVNTGLGASVALWLSGRPDLSPVRLVRLGVEPYKSSGPAAELLAESGLDAAGIERSLRAVMRGDQLRD